MLRRLSQLHMLHTRTSVVFAHVCVCLLIRKCIQLKIIFAIKTQVTRQSSCVLSGGQEMVDSRRPSGSSSSGSQADSGRRQQLS